MHSDGYDLVRDLTSWLLFPARALADRPQPPPRIPKTYPNNLRAEQHLIGLNNHTTGQQRLPPQRHVGFTENIMRNGTLLRFR